MWSAFFCVMGLLGLVGAVCALAWLGMGLFPAVRPPPVMTDDAVSGMAFGVEFYLIFRNLEPFVLRCVKSSALPSAAEEVFAWSGEWAVLEKSGAMVTSWQCVVVR
jgi:hypothetical protein